MCKNLLFILALLLASFAHGQDMLIEQIAGKKIVRQAYNEEKEFISKQIFVVSPLQKMDNRLKVELRVSMYDEDSKLTEKYTTQYTCEPAKSDVLLTVFPFARKGDAEYVIDVSSSDFKRLYDFEPGEKTLNDLSLQMSVKSGILGFFGSKNVIKLTNRNLSKNEEGFILKSNLTIEAYLWGMKVKTISYQVTEKLDDNKQLLYQKFITDDGSYFLMNY
ncbi:MAG: hypothetical protein U5L96_06970 [Owenweeksia sp.]|nr:hypothetical protein [Owenweeksia sp.]